MWDEFRAFLKLHYLQEDPEIFGPLKSDFLLGKIQEQGQSAGNLTKHSCLEAQGWGSSETTREAFILKDNLFKFWFIGFVEGKGSFIINKEGCLVFKITQSSSDAQVLFYIKKSLAFGLVRIQDKKNNTHCYRVEDKQGLFKIISIFNGNLFLDSQKEQFKLWLATYNYKYKENITYLDNNNKPGLSNSWLSGLTDASGCFTCSILDKPIKDTLVKLSFILTPKGNYDQIQYLANILRGKTHLMGNNSPGGYNITVNTTKLALTIKYFNLYPLKTKKHIVYLNWNKIYKLIIVGLRPRRKKTFNFWGFKSYKKI